jgi:tRNA (mo5U34)-methyltransferase
VPPEPTVSDLNARVAQIRWYHTLELAPGLVTPGYFDTRAALEHVPFPARLDGLRCLDVGTFDGFWAFEMEKRGAAEVVAVDIIDPPKWDWPAGSTQAVADAIGDLKGKGNGFEIAHDALGSRVDRRLISVYDLDPDEVGTFDFVYVGSLLLHLRNPIGALVAVRKVVRETGTLLLVDAIDLELTLALGRRPVAGLDGIGRPWWWKPNVAGLVRMAQTAGFTPTQDPVRFYMQFGAGQPIPPVKPAQLLRRHGREAAISRWKGDPHAAVLAKPVPDADLIR